MYPPRSARAASLLVGVVGTSVLQVPTFESIIVQVAHGAFPWSALLPLAAVVVMRSSPVGDEAGKQWSLGHCLIAVTVVGFAAQGMVARTIGVTPYCEVAALAGTIGLALVRLHRELRVSTTAALVAVAILVLLWLDFRELPDTGMVATGIEAAHLPAGFEAIGMRWIRSAALVSAGGLLVAGSRNADGQKWPGGIWFRFTRNHVGELRSAAVRSKSRLADASPAAARPHCPRSSLGCVVGHAGISACCSHISIGTS